jgi:heat shock protein HslJ
MTANTRTFLILAIVAACAAERESGSAPAAEAALSPAQAQAPTQTTAADTPGKPIVRSELTGTRWQLVEIQTTADTQGTTRPDVRSKYTIAFNAGGRVALRLDCNRGSGTYEAEPSGNGGGGSLTIGPLAVTKAYCPPPSLGERIARDLAHVRSYTIANGRLTMSMLANGGSYIWEPAAE